MKAAVFHGPHKPLTIEDVDIAKPIGREVLVRTVASGVCHSDLHFIEGLYPFAAPAILGHEAAGIVEAVGPHVDEFKPGDHVIACLSVFCGHCDYCLTGRTAPLPEPAGAARRTSRRSSPGRARRSTSSPTCRATPSRCWCTSSGLVKVRDDMPLDRAALIGCGVTTGVGAVLNTARVEPGSTVAVFGAGGVGLAAIQGAVIAGARMIIAVDVVDHKLETAKSLGATHAVDASKDDPVKAIRDAHRRRRRLRVRGDRPQEGRRAGLRVPAAGRHGDDRRHDPGRARRSSSTGRSFLREKKIQGCSMGSNRFKVDMPRYVELYRQGRLKLDEMITRRGRLEDVNEAFRAMKAGEVARTVLMFD